MTISKKGQYIAGLLHDKEHLEKELERVKKEHKYTFMFMGDVITQYAAKLYIEEIAEELNNIYEDVNYKPWKA